MATRVEELTDEPAKDWVERYYTRRFLNPDRGMACIEVDGRAYYGRNNQYLDSDISITDCSRKVTLEFFLAPDDVASAKFEDRLAKLDMLIEEFVEFRKWYVGHATNMASD